MRRAIVGDCHLLVHGSKHPTDAEWQRYLAAVERRGDMLELIVTAGGGPVRRQRNAMQRFFEARRQPAAIVVEGGLTNLYVDFWGRDNRPWAVQVFDLADLAKALAFLGIPAHQAPRIESEVARLRQEAGRRPRPAGSSCEGQRHAELPGGQR